MLADGTMLALPRAVHQGEGDHSPKQGRRTRDTPLPRDGPVIVGLRPEHIRIGGQPNRFMATLELVEPTGTQTLLKCRHGDHLLTVIDNDLLDCKPGDELMLGIEPRHLHVFAGHTDLPSQPNNL